MEQDIKMTTYTNEDIKVMEKEAGKIREWFKEVDENTIINDPTATLDVMEQIPLLSNLLLEKAKAIKYLQEILIGEGISYD